MSSSSSVARVALAASESIVDVLPSHPDISFFSSTFKSASENHRGSVKSLPNGADIVAALSAPSSQLKTLTLTSPSKSTISRLIATLPSIANTAVTIHLATNAASSLSRALELRSVVPFVLISSTRIQAHDHALLASRLAYVEKKAVLHIFVESLAQDADSTFEEISEEAVQSFLVAPARPGVTLNGSSRTNGVLPNGHGNGHTNGHANGQANGDALGRPKVNGHARTDSLSRDLDNSPESELYRSYAGAALSTLALVRRAIRSHSYVGPAQPEDVVVTLSSASSLTPSSPSQGVVSISLFRPLPPTKLLSAIPTSTRRVFVLGQSSGPMKWTPLYLDVVGALQAWSSPDRPTIIPVGKGHLPGADLQDETPVTVSSLSPSLPHIPAHEASYTSILSLLFADRLEIENDPSLVSTRGEDATRPEYALGRVKAQIDEREKLVSAVKTVLEDKEADIVPELHSLLAKWLQAKDDGFKSRELGDRILPLLDATSHDHLKAVSDLRAHFPIPSRWIIGSDAWSYDLGASGFHHLVASGLNVNILVIDNQPYSSRAQADPARRKKDAGLYAMNHGDVYVASVAVYSSYSQCLQAFAEADAYTGPSVVLAHLPYTSEDAPALSILQETKLAVDSGYWPLYRWDPTKNVQGSEPFSLDSESIKAELQAFLDQQNHLSQLTLSTPALASELVSSLGQKLVDARTSKAKASYDALLNALQSSAPPLLVLYASDGGAAEKLAKRLGSRATARGLGVRVQTFDSITIESLAHEGQEGTTVVFVSSTAGQGEPPQNGRELIKNINYHASSGSSKPLALEGEAAKGLRYTVFGMGDSKYWPRPEDKNFYNKPGRELDTRLELIGGSRIVDLGLGDDQDADGPETGYKAWEPLLWKALGVSGIEIREAEPEPITNENIKIASNFLRGTIKEGLLDQSTGALAASDGQLTKFHGIYEQDDRDIRDARKEAGLEPAYAFMIRVRLPGGVCKPSQWLAMDRIADERGNGTFKITTRQTFQFHGVIKKHLKPSIQAINRSLLDTIAACGDVNRNVLCSSNPNISHLHAQAYNFAKSVSEYLLPKTTAYHEIWLDKKLVAGEAVKDFEPLYGEYYLPRKFKVAVAVPPNNDVDVFANDVGFIAIADDKGDLVGFNVCIGGGMGVTHSNKKTYPRISDVIGFCTPEQGKYVAEKIMLVQRDNGNRLDRKNARLKYTIDRMGLNVFKAEVEKLLGYQLPAARPFEFVENVDRFGWSKGFDDKNYFTMFIENGRVQDEPGKAFKTGLREIAQAHKGTFRLTANQHLILAEVDDEDVPLMKQLLAKHKLDNVEFSGLRLSSSACVAFPTCGLAMAESERYLPILVDKVEAIMEENGLRNDSIVMRMTGCPNGCARPYLAEVAFVGKAPGSYLMLLGGGYHGQRLNKIFRENVTEPEILALLKPMIKRYALERLEGERFGDFVIRAGYIAPTTSGKEWYDRMGGEGEHRATEQ